MATTNTREANSLTGTSGAGDRCSQNPNATPTTRLRNSAPPTRLLRNGALDEAVSEKVSAARVRASRPAPVQSSLSPVGGGRDSGTCRRVIRMTTAAMGRLTRNAHLQSATSMIHPPKNGPIAPATPVRPDQAPMARERSFVAKEACRIARLPGVSSAAATPWTQRAAISVPTSGANPQPADASAKPRMPMT